VTVERVARSRKRVDDSIRRASGQPLRDTRYIAADTVTELVACAFDGRPAKQPDSQPVPCIRRHTVDPDIVGIREAIDAILSDLLKREDLVALGAVQEQGAVIDKITHMLWVPVEIIFATTMAKSVNQTRILDLVA
jgi:hypothetical protein